MTAPPVLIVPLCFVIAKHCVSLALPVLTSLDPSPLLEFYRRRLGSIRLFRKVEVLRLNRLVIRELPFRCILVRSSSRLLRPVRLACSVYLVSIRCVGSLSLSLGLVLLALLILINSIRSLNLLPLLHLGRRS